jgi:hypothetical protein
MNERLPVAAIDTIQKSVDQLNTLSQLLGADREHGLLGLPWFLDQIADDLLDLLQREGGPSD